MFQVPVDLQLHSLDGISTLAWMPHEVASEVVIGERLIRRTSGRELVGESGEVTY
jgi:hypothetical protein